MACCDLLECSICLSAFRDPHILPRCGHTFCLSCIQPLRDSRCPICRQVFDRRNVRPNFVVQQLLLEGNGAAHSCAGSASAGRPLRPSHAGREHRHGSTREVAAAYEGLGVPPKLADVLAEEDADIALRVYILDNSGSMAAGDGHVMHVDAGGRMRSVPATRWEEVKAMAVQHADWNAQLDVPCEFILLNSPSPSHPTDGVDYVRVDSDHGSVATQQRRLADLLARTRPNMGTPLTERLHDLLFRLRGNVQELQKNGQKVMVTIVTDGAPNGPRQNFVDALRQLTLQVPAFLVIRLCTDENAVTEFYDGIDKEVELSLDIIDDLHGEANNVYRMNPWLTYTPVLQKVREAGTLSKILDFVDERPLLPMEVAVVTQLLLRPATSSQYPRNPEAFLTAVEQELGDAAPVFSGRTNCMSPPVDLRTLKAAVLPQKYSAVGQVAHAVGLGGVADWFFTGKNPFTAAREDSENEDAHTTASGHAALVARSTFIVGQQIEYYSTTKACWYGCNIMQVDSAGSVMVSVKPGQWIPPAQQSTCIRLPSASPGAPAGPPADAVLSGVELIEYRSQSLRCWLPCVVVQRDASSGNVMTNLKPGEWLTPQQQADSIRPFDRHAKPATLHVGQAVVYHSRSQGQWLATLVTSVDPANHHIMVEARPGVWIDIEQQKFYVRPCSTSGGAENSTSLTSQVAAARR